MLHIYNSCNTACDIRSHDNVKELSAILSAYVELSGLTLNSPAASLWGLCCLNRLLELLLCPRSPPRETKRSPPELPGRSPSWRRRSAPQCPSSGTDFCPWVAAGSWEWGECRRQTRLLERCESWVQAQGWTARPASPRYCRESLADAPTPGCSQTGSWRHLWRHSYLQQIYLQNTWSRQKDKHISLNRSWLQDILTYAYFKVLFQRYNSRIYYNICDPGPQNQS